MANCLCALQIIDGRLNGKDRRLTMKNEGAW